MTNKLALAASLVMLMTTSGQAFAAAAPSNQKAVYATAFDQAVAMDAATTHNYHGGPKYND
jgi:hypothetical protein